MKKFIVMLLSLSIILSLGVSAFADSGSGVATVKIPNAPAVVGYIEAGETVPASDAGNGLLAVENGFVDSRWVYFFRVSGTLKAKCRTEVFVKQLNIGEKVEVLSVEGNIAKVKVDGVVAEMETRFLRMKGEKRFESFVVYTRPGNKFKEDPWFRSTHVITLNRNTQITVLEELEENFYLVEVNGAYLYTTGEAFSLAPVEIPVVFVEPPAPPIVWSVEVK